MSNWQKEMTDAIGQQVKTLRGDHTAVWLADRTEELGMKVSRSAISDLEGGRRRSISVAELMVLAAALEIPPAMLLFPGYPYGRVEALPGVDLLTNEAVNWFSGAMKYGGELNSFNRQRFSRLYHLTEEREQTLNALTRLAGDPDSDRMESALDQFKRRLIDIEKEIVELGGTVSGAGNGTR